MDKDIGTGVSEKVREDEQRKWMDKVHIQRLMKLGQSKNAGRKSELSRRKRINKQQTFDGNH